MVINCNELSNILNIEQKKLKRFNLNNGLINSEYLYSELDEIWYNKLNNEFRIEFDYWSFLKKMDDFFRKKNKRQILKNEKMKNDLLILETSKTIQDVIYESFFVKKCEKYIIHVGPTSSGKTHNAIEAIKKSNGWCAFLSPLRLLAWEVYEKLVDTDNSCNLITGEDYIINGSNIVSSTIEMMDTTKHYDVVVIDETFMIGDKFRGKAWTKALFNISANEIHLICNNECLDMMIKLLTSTGKKYEINRYERKIPLEFSKLPTTLDKLKPKTLVVVFSRKSVVRLTNILKDNGYNVSLLYGNLPPEVKKSQIQKFITGENNVCVTTDVIGMGLNVPCDYVCFDQIEKFDGEEIRFLTSIEVRQIGGRSGRYGLSDKGVITATNGYMLDYLKNIYPQDYKIRKGYFGIEEWMIDHLQGKTMKDKLIFFSKLDFIPKEINKIIKKQSIDNLIEILSINKKIDKLDYNLIWRLINLPVSNINSQYFYYMIDQIVVGELIEPPKNIIESIICNEDLVSAEELCKEYELYLYSTKGELSDYFVLEKDLIFVLKEQLIELIDDYISYKKQKK